MKTIGIKLADGTFYPILEEGTPKKRMLDLTTAKDNQTKVQIDLYRSESGTMADAEYVDTLEVSKLNPHAVNDTELHLSVGLDANNELTAEVVDPETGRKSETQVNLITRSAEERTAPADFEVNEPTVEDTISEPSEDFGLANNFADMGEPSHEEMFNTVPETISEPAGIEEPTAEPTADEPVTEPAGIEEPAPQDDTFSFDDISVDDITTEETVADTATAEEEFSDFNLPDFDETPAENTAVENNLVDEPTVSSTDSLDLPDFGDIPDESPKEETADSGSTDFDFPDFGETPAENNLADDSADISTESLDLPDFGDIPDESPKEETADSGSTDFDFLDFGETPSEEKSDSGDIGFDLPDFDNLDTGSTSDSNNFADTSSDLPDFSDMDFDTTPTEEKSTSLDDDFSFKDSEETKSSGSDLFDFPDFDETPSDNSDTSAANDDLNDFLDNDFNALTANTSPSNPLDFSDLYDKETIAGEHASYSDDDDEEEEERSRVPFIICLICAIICILATLLILFVIPSKYNLLKSKNTKNTTVIEKTETVIEKETKLQPVSQSKPSAPVATEKEQTPSLPTYSSAPKKEEANEVSKQNNDVKQETSKNEVVPPSAQENKIVIIPEEAVEKTVPVKVDVPAEKPTEKPVVSVQETKKLTDDVSYTIKWGDTLWDISDSYYKTPWKYLRIADYNKIKNPDIIISGTNILIPAE